MILIKYVSLTDFFFFFFFKFEIGPYLGSSGWAEWNSKYMPLSLTANSTGVHAQEA